uniref:Uncharacterized protein n=1 Tax=Physcomitrium patens TaxID=3218 RepID=A0A2K1J2W6_PHYPA|nr:hypothetical protein PHYPA_021716 [Physcomitrium patens]
MSLAEYVFSRASHASLAVLHAPTKLDFLRIPKLLLKQHDPSFSRWNTTSHQT